MNEAEQSRQVSKFTQHCESCVVQHLYPESIHPHYNLTVQSKALC